MTSIIFFLCFIPILAAILLLINITLAVHKAYKAKSTAFECGYLSFLQTRMQFTISFFIFGLLFLIFDLEIVSILPWVTSTYNNGLFGLSSMLIFTIILSIGFIFEYGKGALNLENQKQKTH